MKSFNHDRTNFRFDEDWDVEESSIALFEVEVVDIWDDSEDFDDDRNDLIPCFLDQASQYGGERTRTCNETKNYFSNIELFFFFYFMPVVEMKEFWKCLKT